MIGANEDAAEDSTPDEPIVPMSRTYPQETEKKVVTKRELDAHVEKRVEEYMASKGMETHQRPVLSRSYSSSHPTTPKVHSREIPTASSSEGLRAKREASDFTERLRELKEMSAAMEPSHTSSLSNIRKSDRRPIGVGSRARAADY
jgi:hypothetical protein